MFVGEDGVDTGGLTREFFRLIATSFSHLNIWNQLVASNAMPLLIKYATSMYSMDIASYLVHFISYEGLYSQLGKIAAMSLVHGGGSFSLFSNTIYNFLCSRDAAELLPSIEEVADTTIKDFLYKVRSYK